MDKHKKLYIGLLIISLISIILCMIFNADGVFGFLLFLFSVYIFIGSILKLCKISNKFKNALVNFIDILFWIP